MTYWEMFEDYLLDRDLLGEEFNQPAVAEDLGVTGWEATRLIQSYQDAQNRKDARTKFVLRRVTGTRTKNAMWHVGERTSDARALGKQWVDDSTRRIERAIEPSLKRITEKNPRARAVVDAQMKAVESVLDMMVAVLDGE